MTGITDQFTSMFGSIIAFIPNLISAILFLLLAWIIAIIVKNIIVKGLNAVGFDKWLEKKGVSSKEDAEQESEGLVATLGKLAYFLVFLLFLPPVFDALNMQSVSNPIREMMTTVLNFVPQILVAAVLLILGLFIAKMLGNLVRNLLNNLNAGRFNSYVNFGRQEEGEGIDIPVASGWIVTTVIGLFFVVQALTVIDLEVFNTIGTAVISYLPAVISALIILTLGFVGGNLLSKGISKSTGNAFIGEISKYLLIIVAVFMTLEQLNFAQNIVNIAFLFIIAAVAIAFAISFGIGGRSFAEKQLQKFEDKVKEGEGRQNE